MRLVLVGLPPSTNNLYTVVDGRQVLSEAGRAYHAAVAAVARRAWPGAPSRRPFAVLVTYHLGAHDRDVDGSHKVVLDGLTREPGDGSPRGLVWHDDRQVILFAARKVRAPEGALPWVSLVLRELDAMPAFRAPAAPRGALAFATEQVPPTTNNSYAAVRERRTGPTGRPVVIGRRRKTAEARDAQDAYAWGFRSLAGRSPLPVLEAPVRVRIRYAIVADRRDVDGSHKLVLDAARGILWRDDGEVVRVSLAKGRAAAGQRPRIEGVIAGPRRAGPSARRAA